MQEKYPDDFYEEINLSNLTADIWGQSFFDELTNTNTLTNKIIGE